MAVVVEFILMVEVVIMAAPVDLVEEEVLLLMDLVDLVEMLNLVMYQLAQVVIHLVMELDSLEVMVTQRLLMALAVAAVLVVLVQLMLILERLVKEDKLLDFHLHSKIQPIPMDILVLLETFGFVVAVVALVRVLAILQVVVVEHLIYLLLILFPILVHLIRMEVLVLVVPTVIGEPPNLVFRDKQTLVPVAAVVDHLMMVVAMAVLV